MITLTDKEIAFIILAVDELHHETIQDRELEETSEKVHYKLVKFAKEREVEIPSWWKIYERK